MNRHQAKFYLFKEEDEEKDERMYDDEEEEDITVGICAMEKKVRSKPMEEILTRLGAFDHFKIVLFPQEMILNQPASEWPKCDCLISFYSKDFPLKKAQDYVELYHPFLINNLEKQWDIMDRLILCRKILKTELI
jgi:inositol hexakisphosphate/diphosphoinositol-pentakisphosphate kinase